MVQPNQMEELLHPFRYPASSAENSPGAGGGSEQRSGVYFDILHLQENAVIESHAHPASGGRQNTQRISITRNLSAFRCGMRTAGWMQRSWREIAVTVGMSLLFYMWRVFTQ